MCSSCRNGFLGNCCNGNRAHCCLFGFIDVPFSRPATHLAMLLFVMVGVPTGCVIFGRVQSVGVARSCGAAFFPRIFCIWCLRLIILLLHIHWRTRSYWFSFRVRCREGIVTSDQFRRLSWKSVFTGLRSTVDSCTSFP